MKDNRKFTEHKLTNPMLRRLAQMVNERSKHGHGTSLLALVDRGLAERIPGGEYPRTHRATAAGREALVKARAQGW